MYKGKGTFQDLVCDADKVFAALDNGKVEFAELNADAPSLEIEGEALDAKLVLDLSDAPIFTVDNYEVSTSGTLDSSDVFIRESILVINLEITY